jgi:hypothetical protein
LALNIKELGINSLVQLLNTFILSGLNDKTQICGRNAYSM